MDQLTARKLLQRRGAPAPPPTNGGSGAPPPKSNNLSPWNSPVLPSRSLLKNNHLNSSVQFLTSAGGSPNLERRSINEGSLKFSSFVDDGGGGNQHASNDGRNGDPVRKRPIKNPRRPRSLSEDRRNSDDFEHLPLLSPSEICIRSPDADPDSLKMVDTAIV
jgi:hypothetical protein